MRNFFGLKTKSKIDPEIGFARLIKVVQETCIIPESYLIEIGMRSGLNNDLIMDMISRKSPINNSTAQEYIEWCIEQIVFAIIIDVGVIDLRRYKNLINLVHLYGCRVEAIDESITKFAETKNQRRN